MRSRLLGTTASLLLFPSPALAHGTLVGRADLPLPQWLFFWAAAVAVGASFVVLAALWQHPKLEHSAFRPLPGGRLLTSRPVDLLCGTLGVLLLLLAFWSGLRGEQAASENLTPTLVYVLFWIGFVPASALLGNVFRAFNPWRALGRAVSFVARTAAGVELPPPFRYPERLGRWPAAVGLVAFTSLELIVTGGGEPRTVALAAAVYTVITALGMALFGVEPWIARGEAFSVYFNLFSRLAPLERRTREIGWRRPLSGLAALQPLPGTLAVTANIQFDLSGYPGAQAP